MSRTIGFIGFEQCTALDLVGPLEAFSTANVHLGTEAYKTLVLSTDGKTFRGESGIVMTANASFGRTPPLDTLIVPGGAGLRTASIGEPVTAFVRAQASTTRRIASVCTGLYALADTGLMKGRRATTHWRFGEQIAKRHPDIRLELDAIHVRDGKFYSSAGVTAGIDLALALIGEDYGEAVALAVARELVVYLKRGGGQAQFSEPLEFQMRAGDAFADLAAWMLRNLRRDLCVAVLAARMKLGTRHFSRTFRATFHMTPAAYVERLRLDEARKRLLLPRQSVETVAHSVGYASADAFRRAFERRFGATPATWRKNFRT